MVTKEIGAGAFKQICLSLLDEVAESKTEVVITKRGRPVARLVPMASDSERERGILAALRGKGKMLVSEAEFLRPSSEEVSWSVLDEDT
ncbi:MAG TPA: type II toxin-antitoxin system prevent-host-death family antitoxin [Polyangia bacterium]|nr:type II toxin-antitoxin system prevent-host-death family antitoxin [Polyangia bacterium]